MTDELISFLLRPSPDTLLDLGVQLRVPRHPQSRTAHLGLSQPQLPRWRVRPHCEQLYLGHRRVACDDMVYKQEGTRRAFHWLDTSDSRCGRCCDAVAAICTDRRRR